MPFYYDPPPTTSNLRQGEILANLWIYIPIGPPPKDSPEESPKFNSSHHKFMIVLSPDCDLEWDFKNRFPDKRDRESLQPIENTENPGKELPHVVLLDLFEDKEIRHIPGMNADLWRRVRGKQDFRYHRFEAASISDVSNSSLTDLTIDFKKVNTLPTQYIYDGIQTGSVRRIALVPTIYTLELVHRFSNYLSRVAVPD